jgi:NADH-ubiquinone oxidoreductase chain 4
MASKISFILSPLALLGGVITRLICMRQTDIKSLIAYSSVSHIRVIISGILSNSKWGLSGALLIILAHGLCSSALFSVVNIIYESLFSRRLFIIKGLLTYTPSLVLIFFVLTAINMSAPPSLNLAGEIILITASTYIRYFLTLALGLLVFLSATYSLTMYNRSTHGPINYAQNPLHIHFNSNFSSLYLHANPLAIIILALPFTFY